MESEVKCYSMTIQKASHGTTSLLLPLSPPLTLPLPFVTPPSLYPFPPPFPPSVYPPPYPPSLYLSFITDTLNGWQRPVSQQLPKLSLMSKAFLKDLPTSRHKFSRIWYSQLNLRSFILDKSLTNVCVCVCVFSDLCAEFSSGFSRACYCMNDGFHMAFCGTCKVAPFPARQPNISGSLQFAISQKQNKVYQTPKATGNQIAVICHYM